MAITVTCSSCERELKVKEELAGRKVKCPACGEAIAVPVPGSNADSEDRPRKKVRAAADEVDEKPRKKRADADDAGDDEDRPRKKKKKKNNNLLIWIGAAVAAVLLLGCLVGLIVVLINLAKPAEVAKGPTNTGPARAGNETPKESKATGKDDNTQTAAPTPTCDRWKLRSEVENDLKQIVLFHKTAATQSTSGKVNLDSLHKTIAQDAPLIWKEIKDGHYVIVSVVNPGDNDIVAYEYCMDRKSGLHVVAFGTRVADVSTAELEKKLGKKIRQN
jgi:hypothetical protein